MITPAFGLTVTERVLPKLALDFTIASLDPRVTFTRTTGASNPATYVNSNGYITTATNNQPRFDYDPVALTCKGLLIEESRANLFLASATPTGTPTNLVQTTPTATPPDGISASVNKIAASAVAGSHYLQNSITVTSGAAYTWSIFIKADGITSVSILMAQNSSPFTNHANIVYDLSAGTITSASSGSGTITAFGNGWYRLTATGTTSSTSELYRLSLLNPGASFTGDGVSGVLLWGTQWEAGAFATSYIPTTTTALTRNADVATMMGTNFSDWYTASAGGVIARVLPSTVSGTRPALQFDDATANEVITLRGITTNPELVIVDGGSPQAQIDAGTISANTVYNLGAAWNTNNCAAAVNGNAAVTDNSATIPTVTQARLGSDGSNYLNGCLQNLRYWPQRIINAEVQAFSK